MTSGVQGDEEEEEKDDKEEEDEKEEKKKEGEEEEEGMKGGRLPCTPSLDDTPYVVGSRCQVAYTLHGRVDLDH